MKIKKSVFADLARLDGFKDYVQGVYLDTLDGTNLAPEFDPLRQQWAFNYFTEDLLRLEPQVNGRPCHLKRAAFLSFWLRREPPIAVLNQVADYNSLSERYKYQTDFILKYGREFCAFRAGYELALFGQRQITPGHIDTVKSYDLSDKFIDEVVEFMKRKNVSPHAMYLIFLSIFERPIGGR